MCGICQAVFRHGDVYKSHIEEHSNQKKKTSSGLSTAALLSVGTNCALPKGELTSTEARIGIACVNSLPNMESMREGVSTNSDNTEEEMSSELDQGCNSDSSRLSGKLNEGASCIDSTVNGRRASPSHDDNVAVLSATPSKEDKMNKRNPVATDVASVSSNTLLPPKMTDACQDVDDQSISKRGSLICRRSSSGNLIISKLSSSDQLTTNLSGGRITKLNIIVGDKAKTVICSEKNNESEGTLLQSSSSCSTSFVNSSSPLVVVATQASVVPPTRAIAINSQATKFRTIPSSPSAQSQNSSPLESNLDGVSVSTEKFTINNSENELSPHAPLKKPKDTISMSATAVESASFSLRPSFIKSNDNASESAVDALTFTDDQLKVRVFTGVILKQLAEKLL